MEIADVKQHIKTGQFDKFYIFYGEEYQIIKLYLKMMAEKGGYEITYVNSLLDLMSGVKTKSLIKNPHLYIIMDDKEYLSTEKMWTKFTGLKDDIVVFYYTTRDKRLKFWKQNEDRAVEFAKLEDRVLIKYIQKDAPFNESDCKLLIDVCQSDYGRILLEIDKVKAYSQAEKVDASWALHKLIDDGIIYRPAHDAIFDYVDAVLERRPAKAYSLLQECKSIGESNLALISVLYNSMKTLLQIQSSKDYKSLGLNGFAIKKVIAHRNNYSNGELVNALKLLRQIEKGIKTGAIPEDMSIDYFMVTIM